MPLPPALVLSLYAHAEAGYPEEVCGAVFAEDVDQYANAEVLRCENRQRELHASDPRAFPRDARTAYSLGGDELLRVARSLDGPRPARILYHSHIDVGAYLSDEDLRVAVCDGRLLYPCDQLVIDVVSGVARGCRVYRFANGRFVEIEHHTRAGGSAHESALA
jgi:adenylyltransferase/sulfurtransferase